MESEAWCNNGIRGKTEFLKVTVKRSAFILKNWKYYNGTRVTEKEEDVEGMLSLFCLEITPSYWIQFSWKDIQEIIITFKMLALTK